MTAKTLKLFTAILAVALAALIGWSIIANNFVVPVVAVALALGFSYLLRRSTKEVTQDERTTLLYEKAAGATIRFSVPVVALAGIILFLVRDSLSPELASAAYVLAYVACGLIIVHLGFYSYYSRKH